jgi:uncharacterized membrane protein
VVAQGPPTSDVVTASDRLRGIDAGRGAAMLFVCLSHFAVNFFKQPNHEATRTAAWYFGMVASPTFMLISGMMAGLLYETRREQFNRIARVLAGRGVFMLTIGHVIIFLTIIPHTPSLRVALSRGFITDAIAVAIIIGPWVVQRVGIVGRWYLCVTLMACAWTMSALWIPDGPIASAVRYLLAGPWNRQMPVNFPLLGWLAVYFAGAALGGWLARRRVQEGAIAMERKLLRLGVLAVACSVLTKLVYMLARDFGLVANGRVDTLYQLTSPLQKLPPSPSYVAFYGGLGLIMTGFLLVAERRGGAWLIDWLSLLGRTSLFVFLLQFVVYNLGLHVIEFPFWTAWPVYFALTLALISLLAKRWDERGLNRWFNVFDWFARPSNEARRA